MACQSGLAAAVATPFAFLLVDAPLGDDDRFLTPRAKGPCPESAQTGQSRSPRPCQRD